MIHDDIFNLIKKLFPLNRSLTGKANRETLNILKTILPKLKIKSIKSGTKVYDWIVPDEWSVKEAYIRDVNGNKIVDFKNNNLHLVSFSTSVKAWLTYDQLQKKIFSIKKLPQAIPYRTTYYKKDWGFCLSENQRKKLKKQKYYVHIDSKFKKGVMNYGEILIRGKSKKEILITSNICHPSMANNELSGPCILIYLAKYINDLKNLNYSYRILFLPETIGSIAYISKNFVSLKKNVLFGMSLVCLAGPGNFTLVSSKYGNNYVDNITKYAFKNYLKKSKILAWYHRGSDERQFGSPIIDIPFISICKTKYDTYKEYHTSLDNLNYIKQTQISLSYNFLIKYICIIENNYTPSIKQPLEPFLQKYGLYGKKDKNSLNNKLNVRSDLLENFLTYADGTNSLCDISNIMGCSFEKILEIYIELKNFKIIN